MGQFVLAVRGIGEAARALDFPVVSGNVSLYNETMGRGILPTPSIGGVGLVADVSRTASIAFKAEGETILLIGGAPGWLGCSSWAAHLGREDHAPPPVDLAAEKRHGGLISALIAQGAVTAVHDLSDGGLAVALAEMACAAGVGAQIETTGGAAFYFGEDQARYVVTAKSADAVLTAAAAAGVPAQRIGLTGGDALDFPDEASIKVEALRQAHEGFFPSLMG
jgi:phosphoribosylformylglycinamidine synthase